MKIPVLSLQPSALRRGSPLDILEKVGALHEANLSVVGVLVAYNTPADRLLGTAKRLAPQLARLVIVDNSDQTPGLSLAVTRASIPKVEYRSAGGNVGIAEAQNEGIRRAMELGSAFCLFLDDDSSFPDDGVEALLDELERERIVSPNTVGIGPRILDVPTGQELTYVWRGPRMRSTQAIGRTEVAFLVSSGAIVDTQAFRTYGLFRSDYFIDQVDKEWGFRVALAGGRFIVSPEVTMKHQLGDNPTKSRSGKVRFQHSSPTRDYYLTRNAIFLMRDLPLPKIHYVDLLRLLVESSVRKALGLSRTAAQRQAVMRGIFHGLTNRRGPAA